MSISNVDQNSYYDYTDPFAAEDDPFKWDPTNDPFALFQRTLSEQPSSVPSTEWISNASSQHLQEGLPPSQTQERSPRQPSPSEVQRVVKRKRSWQTAGMSGSLFGEIDCHLPELPVDTPSGPVQVRGLRGAPLLKAIRAYYGWTPEDLCRYIEQTQPVNYTVNSINTWESLDRISRPAAKVFGSLFRLDPDLFDYFSEKTCQAWDPPLLQKPENHSSESVQQTGNIDELIGLRGAPLLKAIRKYYGWTQEDLRRHIKETRLGSYTVSTINTWETPNQITRKGAQVLGSLFKLDADLFYGDLENACQAWTPPSFPQLSSLPSFEQEGTTERISNVASQHLQEDAPPSQTQESSLVGSPHFGSLEEEEKVIGRRGASLLKAIRKHYKWTPEDLKRQLEQTLGVPYAVRTINTWENTRIPQRAAKALGSLFRLDADLFYSDSKEKKTCQSWSPPCFQQLPVDVSSGPIKVIGLRGASLLKAIRAHYGWSPEDLRRQLKQTLDVSYSVHTINTWENTRIPQRAAKALGSLFRLNADLFCSDSNERKTCQAWDPPFFEQESAPPSQTQERSSPSETVSPPCAALSPVPLSNATDQQFQQAEVPDDLVEPRGGQLLQKMRLSRGWSLAQLGAHVGYKEASIRTWESSNELTGRASKIFGSLFGINPNLFNSHSKKT
jgi:hypothetical protein